MAKREYEYRVALLDGMADGDPLGYIHGVPAWAAVIGGPHDDGGPGVVVRATSRLEAIRLAEPMLSESALRRRLGVLCACGHKQHPAYRCAHRDVDGVLCDCAGGDEEVQP